MTVRFFAAAAAAAGTPERVVPLAAVAPADGYDAGTLGALVAHLGAAPGAAAATAPATRTAPSLAQVLGRSSFLLNEVNVRDRTRPLAEGDTVDVLPPFAGG